ncbi:hypothetical protein HNP00_002464 [Arthrobacter sp. AZCC_0090]|nr:hypothetical protein [Arthrobacter sp. AZCC_0090]
MTRSNDEGHESMHHMTDGDQHFEAPALKMKSGFPGPGTSHDRSCCAPSARSPQVIELQRPARLTAEGRSLDSTGGIYGSAAEQSEVVVAGGAFLMGDAFGEGYSSDGETPVHEMRVDSFRMDATAVTNKMFDNFVQSTGHRTEAEVHGTSAVFHLLVKAPQSDILGGWPARLGGLTSAGRIGRIRRVLPRTDPTFPTIPSSTCLGMTHGPTAPGRAGGSRQRPNGSTPPAEALPANGTVGETS